jgi:phytoene synthase
LNTKDKALQLSFNKSKETTRYYAKSFYFSSFFLPKDKRYAAYSVYDFCRYSDNIIDSSNLSTTEKSKKILELRQIIDKIYTGELEKDDRFYSLSYVVNYYNIPNKYFYDLLIGLEFDNTKVSFETFSELRKYCYHVASIVGLIMTHIFGITSIEALKYAESLGIAMQLTNILRDIKEDTEMDRYYLPAEDLKRFNYSKEELKNKIINNNFINLMKFQIERARSFYQDGLNGFPYLTNDGSRSTVIIMAKTYSSILNKIEKANYNVFSKRIYLSTFEKIFYSMNYFIRAAFSKNNNIISNNKILEET